jgi:hypothetical protein
LFQLSQSGVRSFAIGSGSSQGAEVWGTPMRGKLWRSVGCQEGTGGAADPIARAEQGHAMKLKDEVRGHLATGPACASNRAATENSGQLTPQFACWLMGYPDGWLSLGATETVGRRRSRSKSSGQ